ncbi:class I SAM-dependent methyltransferase [Pseudalkalibacillus sp. R45]|uniref:class I SAM-dependent methyltransferase n=1 Tax=Pseudalkalibacillus sp. R45 TaxID=3457433 RepID=UPI003FCDCEE4
MADAGKLSFKNNAFDGIACTLSIHHFNNLIAPFHEAFRVLEKGRLVIFTSC